MTETNINKNTEQTNHLIQKIYMVADHAGFELLQELHKALVDQNHIQTNLENQSKKVFLNLSPKLETADNYPEVIKNLHATIQNNTENSHNHFMCIAICGSGQGVCMALNRYPELRAGIGYDLESAKSMREHNDANCICLSSSHLNLEQALEIVNLFLPTEASKEIRHTKRVEMLGTM